MKTPEYDHDPESLVSGEISIQEFLDATTLTEKQIREAIDELVASGIPIRISAGANADTFRFSFEKGFLDGIIEEGPV